MPLIEEQLPSFALTALSPLDGRYATQTESLRPIMSEFGLIKYRVLVEIEWIKALAANREFHYLKAFEPSILLKLDNLHQKFTLEDAESIKVIEKKTNHDVKAVEYFLKQKFSAEETLKDSTSFIHFSCTSEDINNLAYSMMLRDARDQVIQPVLSRILTLLGQKADELADQPLLSKTHGQNATPTTMGKEFANFHIRLKTQLDSLLSVKLLGKINGAVGSYNAHVVACPNVNWPDLAKKFVEGLSLDFNSHTTQIEPHDCISEYCDSLARINTILIDFSRDVWSYVSSGYFSQQRIEGEVGSSTMPHKINPIDFENAEGNLGVSSALLRHFSQKLPNSRLQRDLTDSTVLRSVGSAVGYSLLASISLTKGLKKLRVNAATMNSDLDKSWEVLTEPVQTMMRCYGIEDSYEQLKEIARGRPIEKDTLHAFIATLTIPEKAKDVLRSLTPSNYIGLASKLARER
ncbi:adenylosuccinate lyase [Gammaproteobacteria bacterium]|nr:adenylosuccinate lyase [Gammaproteobacteria bacterium]